eukprot:7347171-Prymnesium_polylepis.1
MRNRVANSLHLELTCDRHPEQQPRGPPGDVDEQQARHPSGGCRGRGGDIDDWCRLQPGAAVPAACACRGLQ